MDEYFLHYIWKHQKFTSRKLKLTDGQPLVVFSQGFHNQNSGPDFEEGRLKIAEMEWAGSIEIHVYSSDWHRHNHSDNKAYENVVLHVVWSHDKDIQVNGSVIPTLELKNRVDHALITKYEKYLHTEERIICGPQLNNVPDITFNGMLDRVLVERLELKASEILTDLKKHQNNWENATYQVLAKNFGFSTNKSAFGKLAQKLPFELLRKNLQNLFKTEALLFGQAGFLGEAHDDYQKKLQVEFRFLSSKFDLKEPMDKVEWKLGKMRPANFPTIRLAQFASLLHHNPNLFSNIISIENPKDLIHSLAFKHNAYWESYYDFGKKRKSRATGLGKLSLDYLIINSASPILAAYSKYTGNQLFMDRAVLLLESVAPEMNRYTKEWVKLDRKATSAFESQAQIQLIKHYCDKRKCLDCNIGVQLLSE